MCYGSATAGAAAQLPLMTRRTTPRTTQRTTQRTTTQPHRLAAPRALFAYGTLLFPGVVRALIGRDPDRTAGSVAGWRAAALPGRIYPGLVRADGATAGGHLLTGLTPAEWQIIDAFEDGGYDLTELILTDGRPGWTYTLATDIAPLPSDWSPGLFAVRHLAAYIERCADWRHHRQDVTDAP